MTVLLDLLTSGWISAFAIAVLWVETAALSLLSPEPLRRFRMLAANACSGSCLLSAVGLALAQQNPLWVLLLLAGSLAAHGIDIFLRAEPYAEGFKRRTE
ncbi:hypothetical protein [Rhizobium sp. TRM95796]|uniref:hypothetical protein n=1 Tax=Rhizobium sp. TRM95796 TaxID=2979862 RepID=UPI0021E85C9A|nr:hypothetical protein [Rhizobium sp. TRM95796]MCV3768062.1 hypothetical protein [Rhizobium sp. TRM95796]